MANSLRAKLSKLRYERKISESEYQELIKKLDGHDKQIRVDVIDEVADYIKKHFRIGVNTIDDVVKEFKDQK